jgi:glucose-1-phosphate thymidylyltransferase
LHFVQHNYDTPFRGIILAGGSGSRLYPMTQAFSKQLQPVYDKPMIYYPLSTLMMAGIRDILVITTPLDNPVFERILGTGEQWGTRLSYAVQNKPRGIAEAFLVGRDFIGDAPVCLMLGDNLLYGKLDFLRNAVRQHTIGATVFGYPVQDPERYGVVELAADGTVLSLEEKPAQPRSNLAVPGIYLYDNNVVQIAETLVPSARGELEITDVHKRYLDRGQLSVIPIGRGIAWLDTGTPESLLEAGTFIHAIEKRQGLKIACLEEIALSSGYITAEAYAKVVGAMPSSDYRRYAELFIQKPTSNL